MVDDAIIRRIANLLRIARRHPGEPQGRTAQDFANRLMHKHKVKVVLEADEGTTTRPKIEHRVIETEKRPVWWKTILLNDIAPTYECRSLTTRDLNNLWFLWIVGAPDQVQRCAIHYEWLIGRIALVVSDVGLHPRYPRDEWETGVSCGALQSFVDRLTQRARREQSAQEAVERFQRRLGPSAAAPSHPPPRPTVPMERALVPVQPAELVEVEPPLASSDGGPDVRKTLPTIELDPPQAALNAGYKEAAHYQPKPPPICFGALDDLDLNPATIRALREHNVRSVYDLMRIRPRTLLDLSGVGRRRFFEIVGTMAHYGLEMRPDW